MVGSLDVQSRSSSDRGQHVRQGDAYLTQGKLKEAIIEYRNAVKTLPESADAHYKLARAYSKADDPEKAYQSYIRAADLDPSRVDAHISAGVIVLGAGEYQQARALAERALKADPRTFRGTFCSVTPWRA